MATGDRASDDLDPVEAGGWLDALDAVVAHDGPGRAPELLEQDFGVLADVWSVTSDYARAYADQIRGWVDGSANGERARIDRVLGTDGFGRSDYRRALRRFFEVDRRHVTVAALKALADEGTLPAKTVADAIKRYDIDPTAPGPANAGT